MKNKIEIFMSAVTALLVLFSILVTAAAPLSGAIPASERAALIALYNATDGDDWLNKYGWKDGPLEADGFAAPGTEGNWSGVTVTGDHVTAVIFENEGLWGMLPAALGDLTYLETLRITSGPLAIYGRLSGDIPPELGKLIHLKHLDLGFNHLTGPIPPELGNLTKLESLFLGYNRLYGALPPELGNLTNLKLLNLGTNDYLHGGIPAEWGGMTSLVYLTLTFNDLSGPLPPELGNLSQLFNFEAGLNSFSGGIPPEFGNLTNLDNLDLNNNNLKGAIPPELGNLKKLRSLRLRSNDLSGPIPPELGGLDNLGLLYLDGNELTGPIPPELGNLENLGILGLSYNRLSGRLPSQLGNLTRLDTLSLNGNALTGRIPASFRNLTRLKSAHFGFLGVFTDDDEIRNALTALDPDWESTQTVAPTGVSTVGAAYTSVNLSWTPIAFTDYDGGYRVFYSTADSGPWTDVGRTVDKTADAFTVTGLKPGTRYYFIVRTETDSHWENKSTVLSHFTTPVRARTLDAPPGQDFPPFGEFELPVEGSAPLSGSVAVSGWALDDFGMDSVKIYCLSGENYFYVGDALFVDGARPDVEQAYPGYPGNSKAGWGYMLLTHSLPDGGNGAYTLRAYAYDVLGNETPLGEKTITCDNANAVKPFGAMDTPAAGETVSGGEYINNGWVLTPMPNTVPYDGSTIHVYVDGIYRGHTDYGNWRFDIYDQFPGYANSHGAWAYFELDTTILEDGMHTIHWTATDDAGNTDGIGSRYFNVKNPGIRGKGSGVRVGSGGAAPPAAWGKGVSEDASLDLTPVTVKRGYGRNNAPTEVYPDDEGMITIESKGLERLELHLPPDPSLPLTPDPLSLKNPLSLKIFHGYLMVGAALRPLPIGSTLDTARGVFSWYPGPGFLGEYPLVFVQTQPNGENRIKKIKIKIKPI